MNAAKFDETVKQLKEMGVLVRISHLRRFKIKEPYASGGMTSVGSFNALPETSFKPTDIYVVDPCGGATICQLLLITDTQMIEQAQLVIEATVKCHKKDHYNKRIGRTKALGQALHALTVARNEGKLPSLAI